MQQAVGGFAPEVAVQPVAVGLAGEEMASAAPQGGSMGAATRAVPPVDLAPDAVTVSGSPPAPEPLGGAGVGSPALQSSEAAAPEHAAAAPAAVEAPATEPVVSEAPVLAPIVVPVQPAPAQAPRSAPVATPPLVLSTDEALAPASPVLVSPFAAAASVPVRDSLEETPVEAVAPPEVRSSVFKPVHMRHHASLCLGCWF